jgi:hypothetical protein
MQGPTLGLTSLKSIERIAELADAEQDRLAKRIAAAAAGVEDQPAADTIANEPVGSTLLADGEPPSAKKRKSSAAVGKPAAAGGGSADGAGASTGATGIVVDIEALGGTKKTAKAFEKVDIEYMMWGFSQRSQLAGATPLILAPLAQRFTGIPPVVFIHGGFAGILLVRAGVCSPTGQVG